MTVAWLLGKAEKTHSKRCTQTSLSTTSLMALQFPREIQPLSKGHVSHSVAGLNQEIICDPKDFARTNVTSRDLCEGSGLDLVGPL